MELRAKRGQNGEIVTLSIVKMVAKRPTAPNSDVNFITKMVLRQAFIYLPQVYIMVTGSKTKDISTSIMHGKTLIYGWSIIDRGQWVGLKNNGLFPFSLAIWVRTSPLNENEIQTLFFEIDTVILFLKPTLQHIEDRNCSLKIKMKLYSNYLNKNFNTIQSKIAP